MASGAGTGIGIGIGEGLKSIGESLSRKWMLEHLEREKRADSYEEQARAIAHNISLAGGKDNPATADMQTQLQDIISKHNSLYQPHETPALLARIQRFVGHKVAPPRPDERASMTPASIMAQTPATPTKWQPVGEVFSFQNKNYQRQYDPVRNTYQMSEVPGPTQTDITSERLATSIAQAEALLDPDTFQKIKPMMQALAVGIPYQLLDQTKSLGAEKIQLYNLYVDQKKAKGEPYMELDAWLKDQAKPPNLSNLRPDTIMYKGKATDVVQDMDPDSKTKGNYFIPTKTGLVDITGEQGHYEKPPSTLVTPGLENTIRNQLVQDWDKATKINTEVTRQVNVMETGLRAARRGDMAQGAQAILVTFQKILDPTSVVRESEYMRSAAGQSLLNRIQGAYDRLAQGGAGIPLAELEKFAQLAKEMSSGIDAHTKEVRSRIEQTTDRYKIPNTLIFGTGDTAPPATAPTTGFRIVK